MKIILFTQDDPFYLHDSLNDLINKIQKTKKHKVVSAFISKASPFGKSESFLKKIYKTYKIFGFNFFLFYSIKYFKNKFIFNKTVRKVFSKNNIPFFLLNESINSINTEKKIKKYNADLILIIAGNQIIKKNILNSTRFGVFNVHSSLLPNYRGLLPTFWVLKNNERFTGVTLYKLTEGIDNGPIISQKKISIEPNISHYDLINLLKIQANNLFVKNLNTISLNKTMKSPDGGSYYGFPKRKDVREFIKKNKNFF